LRHACSRHRDGRGRPRAASGERRGAARAARGTGAPGTDMSFDPAAFMDDFRTEAGEHLRALDRHLLALERDPSDSQLIRQMFLSAHTIKGGAAMLEVADVRELAHALEDVLAQLRQSPRRLDPSTADLLFAAVD